MHRGRNSVYSESASGNMIRINLRHSFLEAAGVGQPLHLDDPAFI